MILESLVLLASHLVPPAPHAAPPRCIAAPHEPLRVRRLPGVAATTSKPDNPIEDRLPHCGPEKGDARDNLLGARRRSTPLFGGDMGPARRVLLGGRTLM